MARQMRTTACVNLPGAGLPACSLLRRTKKNSESAAYSTTMTAEYIMGPRSVSVRSTPYEFKNMETAGLYLGESTGVYAFPHRSGRLSFI